MFRDISNAIDQNGANKARRRDSATKAEEKLKKEFKDWEAGLTASLENGKNLCTREVQHDELVDTMLDGPTTSGSHQASTTELASRLPMLPIPLSPRCSLLRRVLTKLPWPVVEMIISMLPRSSQVPRDGISDVLQALLQSQGRSRPSVEGIIARNAGGVFNATISHQRAKFVNWLEKVQRANEWTRDVLFTAMSIVDRYLSRRVLRGNVQVLGASALLIAAKLEALEEPDASRCFEICNLRHLGVSAQNILETETSILVAINFVVASSTAAHILPYFLMANQGRTYLGHDPVSVTDAVLSGMAVLFECETDLDERLAQLAWYLVELALRDFDMVCYAPSEVAAAAIVISNQTYYQCPAWPQMMVQLSGHTEVSLQGCVGRLELLYRAALGKASLFSTQVHATRERPHADAMQPRCDNSAAASQQSSSSASPVGQESQGRQDALRPDLAGVLLQRREARLKVPRRRLQREIRDLGAHPLDGSFAGPVDGDLLHWRATVMGPEGSPYQDGMFTLTIRFPLDYPFNAPSVRFDTRIYHCNVSSDGAIGLSILEHWSPAMDVVKILHAVAAVLHKPNPCEPQPLMQHVAQMYQTDRKKHDRTARDWTRCHATLH